MNSIITAGSSVESVTMFGTRHWAGVTGPSLPDRVGYGEHHRQAVSLAVDEDSKMVWR
jgi:hypothetical protein